jgi:hypothetical protein
MQRPHAGADSVTATSLREKALCGEMVSAGRNFHSGDGRKERGNVARNTQKHRRICGCILATLRHSRNDAPRFSVDAMFVKATLTTSS